jgi:glycosyltransferase involved in cell wall biosynthesis
MKVSGFTFVRNAIKFDYPIVEAITSILPLCDELVVSVGKSDDNTLALVESIDSDKIKIIHSVWDDSLRKGGKVLAVETDKAFDAVAADADWAFYIQADEVVHEKYLPVIKQAMEQYKNDRRVEGLLFNYRHFYGSYDYVGVARAWYRHEIRVIRNNKTIRAYRDAQGFRKNDKKLNVKPIDACIYHYGWVRPPKLMQAKMKNFHSLYRDEQCLDKHVPKTEEFDYSRIDVLVRFMETHPAVIRERIERKNWTFEHDLSKDNRKCREKILHCIEKLTGKRLFEYKNYNII